MAGAGASRAVLRRRYANAFKGVRQQRARESAGSLVDLVRAAAKDQNAAVAPGRAVLPGVGETAGQAAFREALEGLQKHPPQVGDLLVPTHAHPVSWTGRGCQGDAWLPEDFVTECQEALKADFGISAPEDTMLFMAFVDSSFSAEANNFTLARLGDALLHTCGRVWCLDTDKELGAEHQLAALELLSDAVLSKAFLAHPAAQKVLTDLPTAKLLDGRCFYGAHIGRDVVQCLDAAAPDDQRDAAKTRVYAQSLKALLAGVYTEYGMDAAVVFFERYVAPKLLHVVRQSAAAA